jgi:hypothetical protein
MCPACVTSVVLITAGAGSAGGLVAMVALKLRKLFKRKNQEQRR